LLLPLPVLASAHRHKNILRPLCFRLQHNRPARPDFHHGLLGALNRRVGAGYWLRVPVFGWYTSSGKCLEGQGVSPDLHLDIDPLSLESAIDQQMRRAAEVLDAV